MSSSSWDSSAYTLEMVTTCYKKIIEVKSLYIVDNQTIRITNLIFVMHVRENYLYQRQNFFILN